MLHGDSSVWFLLQAPDLNAVAGSSTSTSAVADSGKSVIDLTDDDDTNVPATKPLMQTPRLFLMAPQQTATIPALTMTSPATVVRSIRPLPPLHVAPNQLPRLQVPLCNATVSLVAFCNSL